jgi:hypothetical protein
MYHIKELLYGEAVEMNEEKKFCITFCYCKLHIFNKILFKPKEL